ncbi:MULTISPECIES: hypothetical protein [unclassified Salipiger]|uniref:hypothetical protein n=1 Tax=unclassified Salipiger TaxID=2640570 RepID=UPI0013B98878|nr:MULTISPECIES: hypothetical protein [unclassified Salipiger]NDV48072.1 hypothetical protein [Salipiger sp. PrR003]NDW33264.1 hypothetical protein [Salipiger sp. PrR007]
MRHLLLHALICTLLGTAATPLRAGAWLQPPGRGFASTTTRLSWAQDQPVQNWPRAEMRYDTFYLEYGASRRLTFGTDLGRAISGGGKAVAFVRFPLLGTGPLRVAGELGLGQIEGVRALRPGLSVGFGLEQGWLNADLLAEIREAEGTDYKLDLTLGLRLPRKARLILQIQSGAQQGDEAFARLAPSLVLPLRRRLQIEIGANQGLTGDDSSGIFMGLWSEF